MTSKAEIQRPLNIDIQLCSWVNTRVLRLKIKVNERVDALETTPAAEVSQAIFLLGLLGTDAVREPEAQNWTFTQLHQNRGAERPGLASLPLSVEVNSHYSRIYLCSQLSAFTMRSNNLAH